MTTTTLTNGWVHTTQSLAGIVVRENWLRSHSDKSLAADIMQRSNSSVLLSCYDPIPKGMKHSAYYLTAEDAMQAYDAAALAAATELPLLKRLVIAFFYSWEK